MKSNRCLYLGNTFLFNGYLISSFSLILIVVLILYYIVSKRIRIPTSNSHLKGFTELSVFSYKASPLKKVYKQTSWYERLSLSEEIKYRSSLNKKIIITLVKLNLQRESFRGEQISQFIEQANNHHVSNVKFTKGIFQRRTNIAVRWTSK